MSSPTPTITIYPENSSTGNGTISRMSTMVNGSTNCPIGIKPKSRWKIEFSTTKALLGLVFSFLGSVMWAGTTVTSKLTYIPTHFNAPFFVVYFFTSWMIIFYPVHICAQLIRRRKLFSLKETFREDCTIFSLDTLGIRPHIIVGKIAAFCVLWTLTSYMYLRALSFKGALDATALFASNSCFVYLMSWILLQKRFIAVRIVAFIIAMTGVILMVYMEQDFVSSDIWGVILAVLATAGAGSFQVICKRTFGDVTFGQIALFLSILAITNSLIMWPVFLLLFFTNAEPIDWPLVPWHYVCGSACFALAFNFLFTFGLRVTYPVFISFTFVLAVPLCYGAEEIWNDNLVINEMQISAYVLICLSFPLNIFPELWYDNILNIVSKSKEEQMRDNAHLTPRQRLRHSTVFCSTNA